MKPSAVLSPVKRNASEQRGTLHILINLMLFLQFGNPVTQAVGKQLGDIISNCLILSLHLLTRKKATDYQSANRIFIVYDNSKCYLNVMATVTQAA